MDMLTAVIALVCLVATGVAVRFGYPASAAMLAIVSIGATIAHFAGDVADYLADSIRDTDRSTVQYVARRLDAIEERLRTLHR